MCTMVPALPTSRRQYSNPSLSIFYLHKDARDDLRTQLFEPAASRKDDVPEAQSSAQSSRTAPEETKL